MVAGIVDGNLQTKGGHLVREKSDGSSGYWRVIKLNAVSDLWRQNGTFASEFAPDANQIGGWWYSSPNLRYGRIFHVGDDWDGVTDIEIEIEFCLYSAAVPPGDIYFPLHVLSQANGSASYTPLTVSDAYGIVGGATAYHKDVAYGTISSGDVSAGDYLQIGVAYNPTASDSPNVIFQGMVFKYKTKYPAEEVS
jgi:hypothetical protein